MADVQRRYWTAKEYFADPSTSRSDLDIYIRSPLEYYERRVARTKADPPPGPALRIGTHLHAAVLEPSVWEDTRSRLPGDARASRERQQVEGMLASLEGSRTPAARAARQLLWGEGQSEVSITWRDDATGLACRSRLDRLLVRSSSVLVVELKTTEDPSPEEFARSIHKFGYHRQAAFYLNAAIELVGEARASFAFVVVRKEPPHEVAVYQLDDESIEIGRQEVREAMAALKASRETNTWSAPWENGATTIGLPAWAKGRKR